MDNLSSNTWGSSGLPAYRPGPKTERVVPVTVRSLAAIKNDLLQQLGELVYANPVPVAEKFTEVIQDLNARGLLDEGSALVLGKYCLELFNAGHKDQAFNIFHWINPKSNPEAYKKITFSSEGRSFVVEYGARYIRNSSGQTAEAYHTFEKLIANFFLDKTSLGKSLDRQLECGHSIFTAPYLAKTIILVAGNRGFEKLNDFLVSEIAEIANQMKGLLISFAEQLEEEGVFSFFREMGTVSVAYRQILSESLAHRVEELKVGQSILVSMGSENHEVLCEVERQLNGKLTVRIYNTGIGVTAHSPDPYSEDKYLTHLTYENIESEYLQKPRAWAEFISIRQRIKSQVEEWSKTKEPPPSPGEISQEQIKRHYAEVKKICGNPEPSKNVLTNPHAFQKIQQKGSCSYQVQLAVLRRQVMDHPAFQGKPNEAYAVYKLIKGLVTHEFSKKEDPLRPKVTEALLAKLSMHDKEIALANALAHPISSEREIEIFNQEIDRVNQDRRAAGMPTLTEEDPPLTKIGPKPPRYSTLCYFGLIRGHIKRAAEKGLFNTLDSADSAIKDLVLQRIVRMRGKQFAPPPSAFPPPPSFPPLPKKPG